MTVSTTDSVVEYVSGGPAYPIPYRFLQNSDIQAVLVKQDGTSETLTGAQYTLTGAGTQSGGTLTSAYAAGFLATPGATLTISRVMSPVQPTDLRNQGRFLAETHESVFDRLTMLIQQGFSILGRALLRPIGKSDYDAEGRKITNLGDPVSPSDATPMSWVTSIVTSYYNQAIAYAEALVAGVVGGYGSFIQLGIAAIVRTFQDKMRDIYSSKDFMKLDGSDETAAVQAFVNACIANGKRPYWADGQAVITGNISNFHDLKHTGPGSIFRAGSTFYISPRSFQTNNLYLSPSGSDSNDGLSPGFPRLTLAGSGSALANFGPYLDGLWNVNLAAGQYNETDFTFPPGLRGRNPVYFKGPASVHPAVPTAILDGGGTGSFGFQLNRECTLYLMDLLIRNYASYGIVGQDGCILYGLRCHVVGVPGGPGVKMQQGRVNWIDGRVANCQQNFSFIAGCTFTITSSNPTLAAGTKIENSIQCGVQAQEQSSGHVDFALVAGNPLGYRLVARSRVHSQMSRITGSVTAAVQMYGASDWYNNGSQLDANATGELIYTGSIEVVHYQNNVSPTRRPIDSTLITHTGSTALTVLKTYSDAFLANNFWNSTKSMRFVIAGEITGNGGNKNLVVKIDGVDAIGFTVPAAGVGSYVIDGTLTALSPTQQTYYATCSVNGQPSQVATGARGIPMNSGATPIATIAATLASASDSISIRSVSPFET
ncbi:hypothetical protein [Pseudomonas asiatica]|uniref:hypothetical protein n=1 Tax=Pseudomonas asiatica TaxID=2219225 RepID=UPI003877B811